MNIIVAPHPDDEIIGCYEILKKGDPCIVIYGGGTSANRREEAKKLKECFNNVVGQLFLKEIPSHLISKENTIYGPDPHFEVNPLHREFGFKCEMFLRAGADVIFYNTIMNAPYIHEIKDPEDKKNCLNIIYPSQKSLWETDYKYFLYEGRVKWLV
jgi:hypothetical protein